MISNGVDRGRERDLSVVNARSHVAVLTEMGQIAAQTIADIEHSCDNRWSHLAQDAPFVNAWLWRATAGANELNSCRWECLIRVQESKETGCRISQCTCNTERITGLRTRTQQGMSMFDGAEQGNIDHQRF